MIRKTLLSSILLLLASCGGSPAAPTDIAPVDLAALSTADRES